MSVYVRLRVASEAYAIPVEHVVLVARFGQVTVVPGSRPEMLGVLSLRGQILPVVDLALLLGISSPAPPASLVVAEAGGRQACLAIDEVSEIGELPDPTEETESGMLAGAALIGGELIGFIDVASIFAALDAPAVSGAAWPPAHGADRPVAGSPGGIRP
ncbi:MAG TPA: chemotaxis protein CheW [Streptosporangiaceae bacterium]|nr:chemotaxis protein CheW [Streptosporangiaceae bacterium]